MPEAVPAIAEETVGIHPDDIETRVKATGSWLLVRLDPPITATDGGILVPGQSVPPARTGLVIHAGPGALSDDGKTRMPMHAKAGQRILFERAAGKGLPRTPRETTGKRWGYILLKDGSVCGIIDTPAVSEGEQRALDAGAAGTPPRPDGGFPVSRLRGDIQWEQITPVQDWLVVKADVAPDRVDSPSRVLTDPRGKVLHVVETDPQERYELWSGTVLRQGGGLLSMTRCLDGDRVGRVPHICNVGDRVFFAGQPPWTQSIGAEWKGIPAGGAFLMREDPCVMGVIFQTEK